MTNPLFWSHDSRWLGFASEGAVRKVNVVEGGDPVVVTRGGEIGADWNAEGTIVFGTNPGRAAGGALFRVSAAGGEPIPLTAVNTARGEFAHHHPSQSIMVFRDDQNKTVASMITDVPGL